MSTITISTGSSQGQVTVIPQEYWPVSDPTVCQHNVFVGVMAERKVDDRHSLRCVVLMRKFKLAMPIW